VAQPNRGRVSDPVQAALSGSHHKAPGSAGGYLLAKYPYVQSVGGFNKQNILTGNDPNRLAAGYGSGESMEVLRHLLGTPWAKLVTDGYIVDRVGDGFYAPSDEGIEALQNNEESAGPRQSAGLTSGNDDRRFMQEAVDAALLSRFEEGEPRPFVGAVLVKNGKMLGSAFRGEDALGDHAEFGLLEKKLKWERVAGATLYTTLEPCTIRGKHKMPCAERIVSRKLARVVVGMLDPNQQICGKGIERLREAGIQVDLFPPDLRDEVEDMNRDFKLHQKVKAAAEEEKVKNAIMAIQEADRFPVINPRYDDDLARLDVDFRYDSVLNRDTVFIVVGNGLVSELLDRPSAGRLRDAINVKGIGKRFRRAIIVGAYLWSVESHISKAPIISVGSGEANSASCQILADAQKANISRFPLRTGFGIYGPGPPPRVVLWGITAKDTLAAVEEYIAHPRGLAEFLTNAWR
jgi:pyrimidine deaminase RibD-like protein